MRFGDEQIVNVPGHGAAVEFANNVVYLALALRNGGSGLGVLHGWRARAQPPRDEQVVSRGARLFESAEPTPSGVDAEPSLKEFRRQQLDLYIPAGDTGYWQGALRDPDEPGFVEVRDAIRGRRGIWIDLLYGDYEGGQRTIVRIGVSPWPDTDGERAYVLRYWKVDRQDPRLSSGSSGASASSDSSDSSAAGGGAPGTPSSARLRCQSSRTSLISSPSSALRCSI